MCDFLRILFDNLNAVPIRYAVLRNYENLPDNTGGSDIDVWVHRDDCQKFFDISIAIAKQCNGYLVSYIWKRHEPKICFLGPDWGAQFDVYTGLVPIGDYEFFTGGIIEKHIVDHHGVKVLDENWCAIESLLKEVLNTGKCDRKEKFYNDASKALGVISDKELEDGLPMFSANYCKILKRVGTEPKKQELITLLYKEGLKELKDKVPGYFFDKFLKFKRIFRRPGYMIAILGTDGAGKSAIYNAIYPSLEAAFHSKVYYRHLRPDMLPDIAELFGKRKKSDRPEVCEDPHAKKSSGLVISLVRLLYYLQDYIWGYWLKIWPTISTQSALFVMDRYYYDYYIDQSRARVNLPNWLIRCFEFFVPQPDAIVCLGGDPKLIFERKPETSLEEVERQTKALSSFCEKRKNAFWVDTTDCSLDESAHRALEGITDKLSLRFSKVKHL